MRAEDGKRDLSALSRTELESELRKAEARVAEVETIESDILAAMTHELRTPLNAILGFTDVVLQGLSGPLTDVQRRQLTSVQNSALRLIELVNDVLDLIKARSGQLECAIDEFDLSLSITRTSEAFGPESERRGLALELSIPQGECRALGDRRRFEQVLRLILSNAFKFTEKGRIRIAVSNSGHEASVAIADSGIGIKPEDLDRLFKPFRQLDSGNTRRYDGLGIGLSLSRYLLEAMGGRISVESVYGEGSTFTITLPSRGEGQ